MMGELLGAPSYVPQDESTASTSLVSLATPDRVTFSLDVAALVLIEFTASGYSEVGGNNMGLAILVDLFEKAGGVQTPAGANQPMRVGLSVVASMAAGSHTAEVWFNSAAVSVHLLNRLLKVTRAS